MSFYFGVRRPILLLVILMALHGNPASAAQPELRAAFAGDLDPSTAWAPSGWRGAEGATLDGPGVRQDATVRARWNDRWVAFEFVCRDASIVSPGAVDGLDHFRLGDTVEIFLGRAGEEAYAEVHATPAGRQSRYFFRTYRRAQAAPAAAREITVQAARVRGGWRAVMCVPWSALGGDPRRGGWEVLAGRYDHEIDGGKAVLSSFPVQHTEARDFHARDRYARLLLSP